MNNKFFKAVTTNDVLTENDMPTNSTSSSRIVDLFFTLGASRNLSESDINLIFANAFHEVQDLALRNLFYNRDIRGGQGERRSFRAILKYLASTHPEIVSKNLHNIPFYGRWDDILVLLYTPVENEAIEFIATALRKGDKLCAKWMPREGKSQTEIAKHLMRKLGLTPKKYRKALAGNTDVIESKMCSNKWDEINYNHVPSVASHKYRCAFGKHDYERYTEWLKSLSKPETKNKIHAEAIFPHDVIRPYLKNMSLGGGYLGYLGYDFGPDIKNNIKIDPTIEAQWKALPNYVPEGKSFIPVCDVSGSMKGLPIEVCVALGIYLAERNKGPFSDGFITFSAKPKLQILPHGTLLDKVNNLVNAGWDMNTNLEAVFKLILSKAMESKLAQEDMPKNILILSDMQFDECIISPSISAIQMIEGLYKIAGYKIPNIIFWNLRTSTGFPVKYDKSGTALVSGFSPSIMKTLLEGEMNPLKVVISTLMNERYDRVVI